MGKNDKRLAVKLVISKGPQQEPNDEEEKKNNEDPTSSVDASCSPYSIDVAMDGKFSRKATYEDLQRFTGSKDAIDSDVLKDWVVNYQTKCFPADLEEPNYKPKKCFIKDGKKRENDPCTIYKDFGWKPIKINLKPGTVDVKEQYTQQVCLEHFPFDFAQTKNEILNNNDNNKFDQEITSYLSKSNIVGHPLATELIPNNEETDIVLELKGGMNSTTTFGVLGGNNTPSEEESSEDDEGADTKTKIWKDTKTLRGLLHDVDFPTKEVGANSRQAKYYITATECYMKARIYYKAFFTNDVVTDHQEKFLGKRYWKFPIKYLLQYNKDLPDNAIVLHEDIELKFYTDIAVSMNNKDWDWIKDNDTGGWRKEKVVR